MTFGVVEGGRYTLLDLREDLIRLQKKLEGESNYGYGELNTVTIDIEYRNERFACYQRWIHENIETRQTDLDRVRVLVDRLSGLRDVSVKNGEYLRMQALSLVDALFGMADFPKEIPEEARLELALRAAYISEMRFGYVWEDAQLAKQRELEEAKPQRKGCLGLVTKLFSK